MKKLLSLLTIGFVLFCPVFSKNMNNTGQRYWIQVKEGIININQPDLNLLMQDSAVVEQQRVESLGSSEFSPIEITNISKESLDWYLVMLRYLQNKNPQNIENQQLDLHYVNLLISTAHFLSSKSDIVFLFIAKELLFIFHEQPEKLDRWIVKMGGSHALNVVKKLAQAFEFILPRNQSNMNLKKYFPINERHEIQSRKIIESTFSSPDLAIALNDGTIKLYNLDNLGNSLRGDQYNGLQTEASEIILNYIKTMGQKTFSTSSLLFDQANHAFLYFNTGKNLLKIDLKHNLIKKYDSEKKYMHINHKIMALFSF